MRLLGSAGGVDIGGEHQAEKGLVAVVSCKEQFISVAFGLANNDGIRDNGGEAVNLSTESDKRLVRK